MDFIKSSIIKLIFFLLILALPTPVSAFSTYKIALLPIMDTENIRDAAIPELIQYKIHRKLRFPFYEFIPDTEITGAIKALPLKNGAIIPSKDNLSFLSQTLAADIVLIVEIDKARIHQNHIFSLWDDQTIETTDIVLKCYAYSLADNQYYLSKAARFDSAPLSANSGLLPALTPVIDELLRKLPFSTIPIPVSNELRTPVSP